MKGMLDYRIINTGVDYTFDCTGNVKVMRAALEAAHRGRFAGWGRTSAWPPSQLVSLHAW